MAKYMKNYDFMVFYPNRKNEIPIYTAKIKLDTSKPLDVKKIINEVPDDYPKLSGNEKIMSIKYFPGGNLKSEIKKFDANKFKTLGDILNKLEIDNETVEKLKPEEIRIYLQK